MKTVPVLLSLSCAAVFLAVGITPTSAVPAGSGVIRGHVRLMGKLPGNTVIRMGVDPKCSAANKGRLAVQEIVKAAHDGSLANVFVRLDGTFPKTPAPQTPVVIDQRDCFYVPRVIGMMVGQTLQLKNSDDLLHSVHSLSSNGNDFNVAQIKAGIVNSVKMTHEELMLRLGCDAHNWMTAYVGVVSHPYFGVSDAAGQFQINGVPPGTYTIIAWHERYGPVKKTVNVTAGATASVEFSYTGAESVK